MNGNFGLPMMIGAYGPEVDNELLKMYGIYPNEDDKVTSTRKGEASPEPEVSECDIIETMVFQAHDKGDKKLVKRLREEFRKAALREQTGVTASLCCAAQPADVEASQSPVNVRLELKVGARGELRVLEDGFFYRQLMKLGDIGFVPYAHGVPY